VGPRRRAFRIQAVVSRAQIRLIGEPERKGLPQVESSMNAGIMYGGSDIDELAAYCRKIGVTHICLNTASTPRLDKEGVPDADSLRELKERLARTHLTLAGMTISGSPSREAWLGLPEAQGEITRVRRVIASLGEAGIGTAMFFVISERPWTPDRRAEVKHWRRLVASYRKIAEQAEASKVTLANHAGYYAHEWIRGARGLNELLKAVPSPYVGVNYCTGFHMAGDDPYEAIQLFRDRIFLVHLRDFKRRGELFDETPLGTGEIDFPRVLKLLKGVDYEGVLLPEHFGPEKPGEDLQAQAVQYVKKLL